MRLDLIFMMKDIYSQNLAAGAEVPSLKMSSHGTSLKLSRRLSQLARE